MSDGATTGPQAPPEFLRPKLERMPAELKQRPNWVLWVPIWKGSKWTKRPIQDFRVWREHDKPKTLVPVRRREAGVRACRSSAATSSYARRASRSQRVPVGGVGFVFDGQPDEDGLVFAGVDFDKVITGERHCFTRGRAHQASWIVHRAERIRRRIACDRQSAAVAKRRRSRGCRAVHQWTLLHDDWARTGKRPDRRCSRSVRCACRRIACSERKFMCQRGCTRAPGTANKLQMPRPMRGLASCRPKNKAKLSNMPPCTSPKTRSCLN